MVDDDKTQVLTEGTEDYPLDATLAAAPEPCPNCQTEIATANQFCSKCGYQRGTWGATSDSEDGQAEQDNVAAPPLYFLVNDVDKVGIPEGETVVGRGDVDLKLNDGYLSRQHAMFAATADSLGITDLGSANGSFVDDERLEANEPVMLMPSQTLKLGQTSYTIEKAEPLPVGEADEVEEVVTSSEPEPPEQLVAPDEVTPDGQCGESSSPWCFEYGEGEIIKLALGETTLGRSATKSDVAIAGDGFISSLHLKVTTTPDSLEAEDLGSTNGTKHNGESLQANTPVFLASGDTLQVGETKFVVIQAENETPSEESETEGENCAEAIPPLESSD